MSDLAARLLFDTLCGSQNAVLLLQPGRDFISLFYKLMTVTHVETKVLAGSVFFAWVSCWTRAVASEEQALGARS